jgi:pyruvate,water dikinase
VVIALVQKYLPQDLDGLLAARQVAIEQRDRHVAELREQIADEPQRERFDFWLAAARRQQRGFEDHNYKIDSASTALLHRALTAAARRLAGAGVIPAPEDVWWLRTHEVMLALQALDTPVPADSSDAKAPAVSASPHWHDLVAARRTEHAWRERLAPPQWIGAPPPPREEPASPSSADVAHNGALPEAALVKGQSGSAGKAIGRVRLVSHEALVPDVEEGDVLVARNAGPLWTPVFPLVAAVVLDEGVFFQHAMLTCREYGVPAVFQTKTATQRLAEGQQVTVDGDKGLVLAAD